MKKLVIATQFLTKIPLKLKGEIKKEDLGKSMSFFPLVGLIIGVILVMVNIGASLIFQPLLVNILIITVLVLITGALHLDGFADTLDGFSGGKNKEEILAIMRDGSLGAMGVIGIVCLILVKLGLLYEFTGKMKNCVLVLMPVMGRWSLVFAAFFNPYAWREGLGKPYTEYVGKKEFTFATLTAIFIGIIFLKFESIILFTVVFITTLIFLKFFLKKIGGISGDILGATNEVVEIITLLTILLLLKG